MAGIKEDLDVMIDVPDGYEARMYLLMQRYLLGIPQKLVINSSLIHSV